LQEGFGEVHLPHALARKYPRAGFEWGWQYVFPSKNRSPDPDDGVVRRHHLDESVLQRAVKAAVRASGISKPVHCHTFRHYAEFWTMPRMKIHAGGGAALARLGTA
jgi:integrase